MLIYSRKLLKSIFSRTRCPMILKLGMQHWGLKLYQDCVNDDSGLTLTYLKDLYSTAPKRGSVFIGLMTPDGAIWSRYQRAVLMR